jgi:hypothetical protein
MGLVASGHYFFWHFVARQKVYAGALSLFQVTAQGIYQ